MKFQAKIKKMLSDTLTPVSVFLRLRQVYSECLLLESTDYRGPENSLSIICVNPILKFVLDGDRQVISGSACPEALAEKTDRKEALNNLIKFITSVDIEQKENLPNGFFGYCTYDAVQYFEDIELAAQVDQERSVPQIRYGLYEYLIIFNHFKNELFLLHNQLAGQNAKGDFDKIENLIFNGQTSVFKFQREGSEDSNLSEEEHKQVIENCKKHIARGDVFQIVPSRRFEQGYSGDDFNVYRVLRSINPSPYLFYFEYSDYRIFGSSPEAQIIIKDNTAAIYPIAGTYPRSSDRSDDMELAKSLSEDPKENAEHVMLVDLARNDLSIHCTDVKVEVYKEVQFYSHVIHLVSKVRGLLKPGAHPVSILADTFPAGTLSGAPKYRAMQLIDKYEKGHRGVYGGCLGMITTKGDILHAIIIRTFLSKNNKLYYQAGGGVVFDSKPEYEVAEVKNKLGALKQALIEAEKL